MRVLLVGPADQLPNGVNASFERRRWLTDRVANIQDAAAAVGAGYTDAVVLGPGERADEVQGFLRLADAHNVASIVIGEDAESFRSVGGEFIDSAGTNVTADELCRWRLSTLNRLQRHVRSMERELEHMQILGNRLNQHFREVDDEMRLAARLQRDFLPRDIESMGPLRFRTLFRPATWVSGDIFDVQRLDEHHIGFYIADAVGHGMAAGLLTMFIKRSMTTKRIVGNTYEILDPAESLRLLNNALAQYTLPNCQFVTAIYCLINIETLVMRYAHGGHPYPLLMTADGQASELTSSGGLMGLFPDMECVTSEVQLHPGDRVVLFTDGVEAAFDHLTCDGEPGVFGYHKVFESLTKLGVSEMIPRLNEALDTGIGSLQPEDDVTVLAMEVARPES